MECYSCGFYDSDYEQCTCPSYEMWYACPIESNEQELKQLFENVSHETLKGENNERYSM